MLCSVKLGHWGLSNRNQILHPVGSCRNAHVNIRTVKLTPSMFLVCRQPKFFKVWYSATCIIYYFRTWRNVEFTSGQNVAFNCMLDNILIHYTTKKCWFPKDPLPIWNISLTYVKIYSVEENIIRFTTIKGWNRILCILLLKQIIQSISFDSGYFKAGYFPQGQMLSMLNGVYE